MTSKLTGEGDAAAAVAVKKLVELKLGMSTVRFNLLNNLDPPNLSPKPVSLTLVV